MSTILIKQIPDDYSESIGLAKYNRSRMPGTSDKFTVAIGLDGRFITGIDEEALNVPKGDAEALKATREQLAKKIGKDLDALSPYWETFEVKIQSDKPKVFNTDNALDMVGFKALIANKLVAPNKDAASLPEYRDAHYYAYTEESEISEEVNDMKLRDKAKSLLLDISEDKDRLVLIGQFVEGDKYMRSFSADLLFKMLRAFIVDKNIKNSKAFIAAMKEPIEKLQVKSIVDRALKQRVISRVAVGSKKHIYQFAETTLASSLEELYVNMGLPNFAPELISIQKVLEEK